jgi:general secretion pathway protein G
MRNQVRKAFTLVEILIVVVILGILAAIVIPQFTNASEEAQTGNIQTQLQTVRSQIELFRVRNNGVSPDLDDANPFIDLRVGTNATDPAFQIANSQGRTQETYLRNAPVNPRNGLNTVTDTAGADPIALAASDDAVALAVGWYYDSNSGTIAAAGFDERPASATFNQWIEP